MTKQIPTAKTFGESGAWKLSFEFLSKIKHRVEWAKNYEFIRYEKQIEDVIMALHKLGFIEFDNNNNQKLSDIGSQPFTRKDLDQFKVSRINCDGWLVPPAVENTLRELCKKHNELIEYLSLKEGD